MDDRTAIKVAPSGNTARNSCTEPFLLCDLKEGARDKLGHLVEDILWRGVNYAVYRSERGVYLQFSDLPEEETEQRKKFTAICPELCELRYLTDQMRSGWRSWLGRRTGHPATSLYDHNIAQALMLVVEGDASGGKEIAKQALTMAVQRVTNDNTVRYFRSCLIYGVIILILGCKLETTPALEELRPYIVAGVFGAAGAILSVATRLQAFELKPCNQSNMNYWMSGARLGIGVIAGMVLLLLAPTILSEEMKSLVPTMKSPAGTAVSWQAAAVLGMLGGFAERLIPNFLQRTADRIEAGGTPVEAIRTKATNEGQK